MSAASVRVSDMLGIMGWGSSRKLVSRVESDQAPDACHDERSIAKRRCIQRCRELSLYLYDGTGLLRFIVLFQSKLQGHAQRTQQDNGPTRQIRGDCRWRSRERPFMERNVTCRVVPGTIRNPTAPTPSMR